MSNDREAVSSFWLGPFRDFAFSGESSEEILSLTKVVHSLEQMVRTLLPNQKVFVRLATDRDGESDWSKQKIILPAHYLKEADQFESFAHIVDIWTAIALHEAAHIKLSAELAKIRRDSHEFIVHHIVEDYWMEQWILEQYPGYFAYFHSYHRHFYHKTKDFGEDSISQKLNDFMYAIHDDHDCPLFEETRQAVQLVKTTWEEAKHNQLTEEWDRIHLGEQAFQLLFPGGIATDDEQVKYLTGLTAIDPELMKAPSNAISPYLVGGNIKCKRMLDFHQHYKGRQSLSWASGQMMDTWLQDDNGFQKGSSDNQAVKAVIRQPVLHKEAIEAYRRSFERVKPYIIQLRRKFEKANTHVVEENLGLRQGLLDGETLYRARFSRSLFKLEESSRLVLSQLEIGILIDQSKSMGLLYEETHPTSSLKRFEVAMDLGVLFVEALRPLHAIDICAYAYSTAQHSHFLQLEELYSSDFNDPRRLGLIEPKHATPEFLAIKELTLKLLSTGNHSSAKIILVISDGNPDDYQYGGGEEHQKQIQDWIKKWSKKSFSFAHISLAGEMKKEMYPQSIHFEQDYSLLVSRVSSWIAKTISRLG